MRPLIKVILVVSFLLFAANCLLLTAEGAVPHLINFQGKLTDPSTGYPLTGSYAITFRIYDAGAGGNLLWQESHSGTLVSKGVFSVMLGSITNLDLPFDKNYWISIQVGSDPEMSPRQRLTSTGYAFRAEEVDSIPRGIIAMWSGTIADIPDGWALCDGTNGTPDLRDRFVVGSGSGYSVGDTGGEAMHTLTVAEMPPHTHTKGVNIGGAGSAGDWSYGSQVSASDTGSTGGGQPHENRPPYYALAYIMKL